MSLRLSELQDNKGLKNLFIVGNEGDRNKLAQIICNFEKDYDITYIAKNKENYDWAACADRYFRVVPKLSLEGLVSALVGEVKDDNARSIIVIDFSDFDDKMSLRALVKHCRKYNVSTILLSQEEDAFCRKYSYFIKCGE